MVSLADDRFVDPLAPDESCIDERAVMHDDDEPGGGSDAADYYYLLKDLYTVVGLAQANGHEAERYVYDAYGKATVVSVLAADVNFDGGVDSLDQGVIRSPSQWLQSGCDAGTVYDINMDGTIDSLDQGVIRNPANWMQSNTELSASALGNPYFFTARRRDAYLDAPVGTTGVKQIQYNRNRYYNYDRWLQRDPSGIAPAIVWHAERVSSGPTVELPDYPGRQYADGANLYAYVRSNPLRFTDPDGLTSKCVCGPDFTDVLVLQLEELAKWDEKLKKRWLKRRLPGTGIKWLLTHGGGLDWGQRKKTPYFGGKCATGPCAETYSLCGHCVRSGYIGDLMFSMMAQLLGTRKVNQWLGAHAAELAEDLDFDAPESQYTYGLGWELVEDTFRGDWGSGLWNWRIDAWSGLSDRREKICSYVEQNIKLTANRSQPSSSVGGGGTAPFDLKKCAKCPMRLAKPKHYVIEFSTDSWWDF